MTKRPALFVMLLLLMSWSSVSAQDSAPEILWDEWGTPHIYAQDELGLFYALGWAQAHNHGDLILRLYGQARGRAAEYWGPDFLESDRLVHTLGIPAQGEAGYARLPEDFRGNIDAFAAGINDYAAANPDLIGESWQAVLPISAADVLAHGVRTLRYNFVARAGVNYALDQPQEEPSGSNAWAIGPSRSASGKAMLLANPHQPWADLGLWIEAHLVLPDLNLYGAALVGNPVLGIAFNEYLGWSHTVNTHDGWDLYELALTESGEAYRFDGEDLPFEQREEVILVLEEDGTLSEETLLIRESLQGPVLSYDAASGKALALRVVGERTPEATLQWWQMARATSLEEFEAVMSDIRIPMFTVMYADREGNILSLFNEQVPIRSEGDWDFWNGTSILGGEPSLIPGDDPAYVWTDYHPYEDLPRVLNPDTGWLQNANEPPWTTTLPLALDPADYPPYISPLPYTWPRPIQSMRLLFEDDSISFDELIDYKFSSYVELTRPILDDLIAAARERGTPLLTQAANVLEAWDRRADAESRGAVLFALWAADYVGEVGFAVFEEQWSVDEPLTTPRGLADPEAAVDALEQSALQLEAARLVGAGMDVPFGDVFRLRYPGSDADLPASGAPDALGTFSILTFVPDGFLRFRPVHGDSYIALVEFGETVQARVLLTYGNATQAHSPHVGDQLELFSRQELREALLSRADVEAHSVRRESLQSAP